MTVAPGEDPRRLQLVQLEQQLQSFESQLASIPAQRFSTAAQHEQQQSAAQQRMTQTQFERTAVQQEIERLEAQRDQQIAAVESQRPQLEAQQAAIQRELAKPPERQSEPVEVLEQRFDNVADQLGSLPAQLAQIQSQHLAARADPEERQRQLSVAEAEIQRDLGQANLQQQQQDAALNAQEAQLTAQIEAARAQVAALGEALDEESNQAEAERTLAERTEQLEAELERLRSERAELRQLVEASRDVTSADAAVDLSESYTDEATEHRKAWRLWLWGLFGSLLFAAAGGAVTILELRPEDDATNAEIATAVLAQLLIIGLLLYLIRVSSRQFAAHRHLEAVSRNKSAALATFNRIVSGPSEPEVRTAVAAALAQAVFTTGETGFIDEGSENITLIERAVAPIVQRVAP